ncbi:MAG: hypothetical protein MJ107_01270 [Lachnospiraceae bacterium]|nr:hypothetical protein [Lachnospiraceae bacterium]
MVLMGLKKQGGWVDSQWATTYPTKWEHMRKAAYVLADHYEGYEVLVDGKKIEAASKEEYLTIPEATALTFRGMSTLLKHPLSITLHKDNNNAVVSVALTTDEYISADYQQVNIMLSPYLDGLEINIFRN